MRRLRVNKPSRGESNLSRCKPFGVDIDPNNDLHEKILPDGDVAAFYKGKRVDYDKDYIDILEERMDKVSRGKKPTSKMY